MNKPSIPKQFLGAFKAGHRASAREFIDEELSYQLLNKILRSNWQDKESITQLEYITKFNNEYHKNVVKKGSETDLHNTEELRKDCYARENARNRDIMSKERYKVQSIEPNILEGESDALRTDTFINKNRNLADHEDTIISLIQASWDNKDNKI